MKKINFDLIKNVHWLIMAIFPLITYFFKENKKRLNRSEKKLLTKINKDKKGYIVFIKFDNTSPYNKKGFKYDDPNISSLVRKGFLYKEETDKSIIYKISKK